MKRDQVIDLLSQPGAAPRVAESRFIRHKSGDMRTAPGRKVLAAPHPYRWLAVDPSVRGIVVLTLDQPLTSSGAELLTLHPGCWAPIHAREVYAVLVSKNGQVPAADNDDVILWLTSEASPPALVVEGGTRNNEVDVVPGAGEPSAATDGDYIPSGMNYVTVHIHDNDSGERIQGAETADIEVWWFNEASGIWMHNPADDFDADGLGSADAGHDYHVFHVPNFTNRIYLRNVAGNTVWADLLMSKDIA